MNAEVDALVALVERWQKSRRAVRDAEDQDALGMAEQVLDVHEAALLAWTRPTAPVGEANGDKAKHMRDSMPRFSQAEIKRLRAKE